MPTTTTVTLPTPEYTTPAPTLCNYCHAEDAFSDDTYGRCIACFVILNWDITGRKLRNARRHFRAQARRQFRDRPLITCRACGGQTVDPESHPCLADTDRDIGDLYDLDDGGREYRIA